MRASGRGEPMDNELFASYFELGFGAFMSTVTVGIFLYLLIVKLFDIFFHRKFPAGWKYALSVAIPVFLLIPIKFIAPWSIIPLINFNMPLYIKSPEPILVDGITETNYYFTGAEAQGEFLYKALFYIWLAGAVITFAYQMIKLAGLNKSVRRRSIPCGNTLYKALLEKICSENKVKSPLLLIFPETDTPFAMGIFKTKIILPSEEFSEKEIGYILRHEVTHIRRKDIFIKLLLMIFRCMNWFNPLAYIMVKNAYGDMEITCDEAASQGFTDTERSEYSKTILKGVSKVKYPAVTTYLSPTAKLTKKRIDAVMTVKKLGSAIPFVLAFFSVTFMAQTFYAVPDELNGFYTYTDPYPIEADPYVISDEWRTAQADSVSEAGEKIFRQYMEMYMGEDVPEYYRINEYKIDGVFVPSEDFDHWETDLPDTILRWETMGVFTKSLYANIQYRFIPANQCGNTVHNKNFGMDTHLNGVYFRCYMGFELEKNGNQYTAVNMGTVSTYGGANYHFENKLTGDFGLLGYATAMAQSGLLDYSWNDTDDLPAPGDICEYSYRLSLISQMTRPNTDPKESEYFPQAMAFKTTMDIDWEHIAKADCRYMGDDGCYYMDTSEFIYDESKCFEYCGYEHDLESGSSVVYGNVTGDEPHGVKMYIYTNSEDLINRKLHAVEVTDELYTLYVFHDSFSELVLPENITSAEDILEYMKTPHDGCDFTVMDYRNITEEKDGIYAEVRFKGRLDGQYSVDLTKDDGDGYLKTKIV